MKVVLYYRHYGVHQKIKEADLPGDFAEWVVAGEGVGGRGWEDSLGVHEDHLIAALPADFIPTRYDAVLLTVEDEGGGTGLTRLTRFRPWAKYFDAHCLSLVMDGSERRLPTHPEFTEVVRVVSERERLGREVRAEWVAWAGEQPEESRGRSWLLPYDLLPAPDREVDDRIGWRLYALGRQETFTEMLPRALTAYRRILREALLEEMDGGSTAGRLLLRDRLDQELDRAQVLLLTGEDPAREDYEAQITLPIRVDDELAASIAAKRAQFDDRTGEDR